MTPIILIDDQKIANFITIKLLQLEGIEENISDFTDPKEAFAQLQKMEKEVLIFLDLNMPEMSGWEFLDKMNQEKIMHPTVILTSSTSKLDQEKSEQYPMVIDYIIKPLNQGKIKNILDRFPAIKPNPVSR